MKVMPLLGYALRGLVRRKAKATVLVLGLASGVALLAAVLFMTDALRAQADRLRMAMPDIVVQKLVAGRPSTLPRAFVGKIAPIPAVRAVRPRVWGYLFLPALQGNVTVVGVPAGVRPLEQVQGTLGQGRDLVPGAHEMVAGATLAQALGLLEGDTLGLPSLGGTAVPLTFVGAFSSSVDLYTADVVLCDEADARVLLGMGPDEATDFAVDLTNPAESSVIAQTIAEGTPGLRVLEREPLARIHSLTYGRRSGLFFVGAIPAILALLLLMSDRASGLSREERREVSVLKAIGWSTEEVLYTKVFEAALTGSIATALGLFLAYGWVFWLGAIGLRATLAGWSSVYPDLALVPAVDPAQLLAIAGAVLLPYVGLCVVPSWRAAAADPVAVMRGE